MTSGVASLLSSWTGTWWSQRHETAGKSREKSNCPAPTPMPNSWPVFKTILSLQGTITYPLPRDFWRFSFSEGGFCDRSLQGSRSRGKWRHHYGGKNPLRRYSFNELQHWKQNTWTPAISFLHIFNKTGEDYVCMYKLICIYIYIYYITLQAGGWLTLKRTTRALWWLFWQGRVSYFRSVPNLW